MINVNILVFDDDRTICETAVKAVSKCVKTRFGMSDIDIFGIAATEKTEYWINDNKPDIAVLDIITDSDESFGLKLARQIRKKYRDCHIVFITSDESKLTQVFGGLIRPTQFIVKGGDFSELEEVICEIIEDLSGANEKVKVSYGRNEYMLNCSDIVLIQKSGRKTEIFLENRRIEVADTVSGIAKMLPEHFKTVDKGVVVNLKMVTEAKYPEKSLLLTDGQVVYMSRNSIHEVKNALSELVRRGEHAGAYAG